MSLSLRALLAAVIYLSALVPAQTAAASFLFSIGDPTDDEQLYLELLNRARANAPAEAQRLIALDDVYVQNALKNVNTNLMVQQFSTNPAAMPLSFNAQLINAARAHAQYQFNNGIQSHVGPGTNTLAQRLQTAGYPYFWATENVYSYAQSAVHGHAAFEIDWTGDNSNGGMQTPPAHRDHNHDRRFVEIGIGVINGTNKVGTNVAVGPQLVAQDFGTTSPSMTYITGVAYYDLNGNNFYDLGEGLSGVTVTVDNVDAYAITSSSGGYSIPVTPNQNYTVRFAAAGAPQVVNAISIATTNNVKLDLKPTFAPSIVTSAPTTTYAGISNLFTFSTLPGATAYRTRVFPLRTMPVEGAEGALTNVSLTTFGGYATLSSMVKASGNNSFHLRHITDNGSGDPTAHPQLIKFVNPFFVKTGAKVDFQSRLGIAFSGNQTTGPGEIARLEISTDDGKSWGSIWLQAGTEQDKGPDNSEKVFNARSVSLASYVGKLVMLRFNFDVNPVVGWFDQSGDKYGWYIDDITITSAEEAINPTMTTLDGSATFQFAPANAGNYILQFAATAGARNFPFGPWHAVTAQPSPPMVNMEDNLTIVSNGVISMKVVKVSGTVTTLTVQSAPTPAGPWTTESGAVVNGLVGNEYTIDVPMSGSARFYRVGAN
jgi:hypothetical protein